MRNVRSLNISNTYRSANINTRVRKPKNLLLACQPIKDYYQKKVHRPVTAHQLHMVYQQFKKRPEHFKKMFVGYNPDSYHLKLKNKRIILMKLKQVARDGLPLRYYTQGVFPLSLLKASHNNRNALMIYEYHGHISDESLSSMFNVARLCRLGIEIPIIFGQTDLLAVMVYLFDARFLAERVELDFVGFPKTTLDRYVTAGKMTPDDKSLYTIYKNGRYYPSTQARLNCYAKVHEVFARWKYQLYLICETQHQADVVKKKGLKIANE